jgi:hypothetical protein
MNFLAKFKLDAIPFAFKFDARFSRLWTFKVRSLALKDQTSSLHFCDFVAKQAEHFSNKIVTVVVQYW